MIIVIAIFLVTAFVMLRKRKRKRSEKPPPATVPYSSAPAVVAASQPLPKNCPYCGTEITGAPFCGNSERN